MKNLQWSHRSINIVTLHRGKVAQHRLGLGIIGAQAVADDLLIGVIEAIIAQGTLLKTSHQLVPVRTGKMKNPTHLDMGLHEHGLSDIAWNSVQNEVITLGLELPRLLGLADRLMPKPDCHLVGHEFPLAGVLEKLRAEFAGRIKGSENITASAVVESRYLAQNLALGSLAASRSAENQDSAVT